MDPQEQQQAQAMEEMKRQLLAKILTPEAFERLGRIRTVNPSLAAQAEMALVRIAQEGKVQERITDEHLKELLRALSEKKDIKIQRK